MALNAVLKGLGGLLGTPARANSDPDSTAIPTKPAPLQAKSPNRDASLTQQENALTAALKRASQEGKLSSESTPSRLSSNPIELEVDEAGNVVFADDAELPSAEAILRGDVRTVRSPSKASSAAQPAVVVHPPTSEAGSAEPAQQQQDEMAAPSGLVAAPEGGKKSKGKGKKKEKESVKAVEALDMNEMDGLVGPDDEWQATQVPRRSDDPWPRDGDNAGPQQDDQNEDEPVEPTASAPVQARNPPKPSTRIPQVVIPPVPKSPASPSKTKSSASRVAGAASSMHQIDSDDRFPPPGDSEDQAEPPPSSRRPSQTRQKAKKKPALAPPAKVASTSSKSKIKTKQSTRGPVAKSRKVLKSKSIVDDEDEEKQVETADEVMEDEPEVSQSSSQLPTIKAFDDPKLWKSYSACALATDSADEEPIRVGDCLYVIPGDQKVMPDDTDRSKYWIAEVVNIKADKSREIVPASATPSGGRSMAAGDIVLKVKWFWRLRDFDPDGTKGHKKIVKQLKSLGFRTTIVDGDNAQFRLQDRELIATDNHDVISLDSIAGRADVFRFDDDPDEGESILKQIVNERCGDLSEAPEHTGLDNFYCRLEWDFGKKPWVPALPSHCFCGKHYDPEHKQVFCPREGVWYHAACLSAKGHYKTLEETGGDRPKGKGKRGRDDGAEKGKGKAKKVRMEVDEGTVPEKLRALAESSITRGGDGGMLVGNIDMVQQAQDLVKAIERGDERMSDEEIDAWIADWERSESYVASYTRAVGKTKKNERLDEGVAFVCPTCEVFI